MVSSQVPLGMKDTMNIQTFELISVRTQPGLFAQAVCSENMVIPLLGQDQVWACVWLAYISLHLPTSSGYWEHWGGVRAAYMTSTPGQV